MKVSFLTIVMLITIFLASNLQAHTVYKWVDENGAVNYSDDYDKVPPAYRDRIEVEWVHEEGTSPPVQKMTPQKREETKADIYGQDEAYWRGKVRPWKEFLKAAEANYERAHEKFMEKEGELSRIKYGSKSRIRIIIREMDQLKEEMMGYEAQIAEAKEALEKISKEAKESKANPDWLN